MKTKIVTKELILENLTKQHTPRPSFLRNNNITRKECYDIVYGPRKCNFCENEAKFLNFVAGYHETCGNKDCAYKKRKITTLEIYGVENISQCNNIKKKKADTCLERYGATDYRNSKHNNKNMYIDGVHVAHTERAKEKRRKTIFEKYGVTDPFLINNGRKRGLDKCNNDPETKKKREKTCIERYGVNHIAKSEDFQEKIRQSNVEKYGVHNPMLSEIGRKPFDESVAQRLNDICDDGLNAFERSAAQARETNMENGRWLSDDQKEEYYLYKQKVWRYTRQTRPETLENYEKRGRLEVPGTYQLDHKYSIFQGFVDNIDPKIIGSIHNLEFIPSIDNASKGNSCSITKEGLFELYEKSEDIPS